MMKKKPLKSLNKHQIFKGKCVAECEVSVTFL